MTTSTTCRPSTALSGSSKQLPSGHQRQASVQPAVHDDARPLTPEALSIHCTHDLRVGPVRCLGEPEKHRVVFEEAQTIFCDDFAVQFFDDEHSSAEEWFIMLGMPSNLWGEGCRCHRSSGHHQLSWSFGKGTPQGVSARHRRLPRQLCREGNQSGEAGFRQVTAAPAA
jgi:hypothetical protein